jgi:hypothetical protein
MRLGLVVISAAAVVGGYMLVNTIQSDPADPSGQSSVEKTVRGWMPGAIDEDEPATETRSYELIRYMNKDGSVGMVDHESRVPPGAKILGRERKTAVVPKSAPAKPAQFASKKSRPEPDADEPQLSPEMRDAAGRPLTDAEKAVMKRVLETGVFPDAHQLEQMQGDLDAVGRERGQPDPDEASRAD